VLEGQRVSQWATGCPIIIARSAVVTQITDRARIMGRPVVREGKGGEDVYTGTK